MYNSAFVPLAGAAHPILMGSTCKQGFLELWQGISPLFESRRTAVFNMIAAPTDLTTESVCQHIIQCLKTNEKDVTMALMYQDDGEGDSRNAIQFCGKLECLLLIRSRRAVRTGPAQRR
jgi:hypothetical protein